MPTAVFDPRPMKPVIIGVVRGPMDVWLSVAFELQFQIPREISRSRCPRSSGLSDIDLAGGRFRDLSTTLLLVTFDESGGVFDHVKPPPTNAVDNQPYGPRIPLMALGPFVRINFVSHVQMEHPSIVEFIEWNWLGGKTGQLGTRDTTANNLGSLLDPTKTRVTVPEL